MVFTVLNYHSSSDQVHPRNKIFKTSRRIYKVDRLSQTIICTYSKNRSLYNVVFTVLNYHSSSDQVHPRNNIFKTSRRIYVVDRLSQTIICT